MGLLKNVKDGAVSRAKQAGTIAIGTIDQIVADSFAEYLRCPGFDTQTFMTPAEVVSRETNAKFKANTKRTENVISDGSLFDVAINQCAILVENGKVKECVIANTNDLAGQYQYRSDLEPSWLSGVEEGFENASFISKFKDAAGRAADEFKHRLAFGGQSTNTMYLFYINLKPLPAIKVGAGNIMLKEQSFNQVVKMGIHGTLSVKVADPIYFYENVIQDPSVPFSLTSSDGQSYMTGARNAITTSLKGVATSAIKKTGSIEWWDFQNCQDEVREAVEEVIGPRLLDEYGLMISQVALESTVDEKAEKMLTEFMEKKAKGSDADYLRGQYAEASLQAMQAAASNPNGAMMGIMGMNGVMNAAGNMGNPYGMSTPQPIQQPAPTPQPVVSDTWTCSCGASGITSKFCPSCGKPKPAPKPAEKGWTCECGTSSITSKFCPECGKPKPVDTGWTCSCGASNITSKFCPECGKSKPENNTQPEGWTCSCGATGITSKFCPNCGQPQQVIKSYKCAKCGWTPPNPTNPPKFCPGCGDIFDDNDLV